MAPLRRIAISQRCATSQGGPKGPFRVCSGGLCYDSFVGTNPKGAFEGGLVTDPRRAGAAVLAVAVMGAVGATSAIAGVTGVARRPSATAAPIPVAVQTIADRLGTTTLLLRPQANLLAAKARERAPQSHSSFPGFAYCTQDVLVNDEGELFAWPVADSGHDAVITIFNLVKSSYADFSAAEVTPSTLLGIQYGGQFYNYDTDLNEISWGPGDYIDSWVFWGWLDATDRYVALVNQAVFVDDGVFSSPYAYVAPAFGPYVVDGSSSACFN
jgi:hypothetical protein